jgi:DnaJ-class molecular chaperone
MPTSVIYCQEAEIAEKRVDQFASQATVDAPRRCHPGNGSGTMGNEKPGHVYSARPSLSPGDQAEPETPEAGENLCRECQGTGRIGDKECPTCRGTGIVVEKIGGE